ncbi:MAG: hypothetical protein ABI851_06490 [Saprospiraceae bacterium]
MIFGNNNLYDRKNIKCFSTKGQDSTFFEVSFIEWHYQNNDSAMSIRFSPETDA